MTLIEAGAHMDAVNIYGETPFETASTGTRVKLFFHTCNIYESDFTFLPVTGVAEIILRTQSKLSLKCIAAKAIKRYSLSYKGQVPHPLEGFIELHGAGTTQR